MRNLSKINNLFLSLFVIFGACSCAFSNQDDEILQQLNQVINNKLSITPENVQIIDTLTLNKILGVRGFEIFPKTALSNKNFPQNNPLIYKIYILLFHIKDC